MSFRAKSFNVDFNSNLFIDEVKIIGTHYVEQNFVNFLGVLLSYPNFIKKWTKHIPRLGFVETEIQNEPFKKCPP